jgi:hypothetical protein
MRQASGPAVLGNDPTTVTVHLDGHKRVLEAMPVIIQIHNGIEKGVAQFMV